LIHDIHCNDRFYDRYFKIHFSKVLKTLEKCIFCIGTIRKFLHGFLEGIVFQNVKTDPMICRTIPAKQRPTMNVMRLDCCLCPETLAIRDRLKRITCSMIHLLTSLLDLSLNDRLLKTCILPVFKKCLKHWENVFSVEAKSVNLIAQKNVDF
jgi:hypothetical protein